jgi:hypothetical protein
VSVIEPTALVAPLIVNCVRSVVTLNGASLDDHKFPGRSVDVIVLSPSSSAGFRIRQSSNVPPYQYFQVFE